MANEETTPKKVKIDPKHVTIDPQGKVVITNKEFAQHLEDALKHGKAKDFTGDALLDVNFGC
jgi:hypothetical protein